MPPFEDLDVWKRSARLSADIYKVLSQLKDYGYRDQVTRAGQEPPKVLNWRPRILWKTGQSAETVAFVPSR